MNLNNPHDKLFKAILQDKTLAKAYFSHFLPANLTEKIDFDSILLTDGSFIDEQLRASFADIVFSCRLRTGQVPVDICILIEHKSYIDPYTPFQFLYYLASAWMKTIASNQKPRLIIPILFYHGSKPWDYATIETHFATLASDLKCFLPNFDFVFSNLQALSDEKIWMVQNQFLAASFLALKHNHDSLWIERHLVELFSQILPGKSNLNWQFSVYVFNFVTLSQELRVELLENIPPNRKDEIMNTLELLRQEGRQEEAVRRTTEFVLSSFKNGIDIQLIGKIMKISTEEVIGILKEHHLV